MATEAVKSDSAERSPIYFVLGGPGSGKGTNCQLLAQEFGLSHFSAGELLRAESKRDTPLGKKIAEILPTGAIVPMEITIGLLVEAMRRSPNPHGFLLDGFPRKMDQALKFENEVGLATRIIYFDCPLEVMKERIFARMKEGSARSDDNIETLERRFRTNVHDCMPVIEKYKAEGRLTTIMATGSIEEVYETVRQAFLEWGYKPVAHI